VLDDVLAGLVSIEKAFEDYGVVIDPTTIAVNTAETDAERSRRRKAAA
jgi:hypothetical protein